MSEKSSALLWLELIWKLQLEKVQPWNDSSLACWLPGSAESRADTAHINFARFHAEPAKPLCKQWVIIHQQNVRGHFVSWKVQYSGLHLVLEESHALLRVSCSLQWSWARSQDMSLKSSSSRSKLNRLLVGGMLSLPLPDAAHLEAMAMIVGTKTRSNSYAWIPNVHRFLNTKCLWIFAGNYIFNKWLTTCS